MDRQEIKRRMSGIPVIDKRILRPSSLSVTIKQKEIPSVLSDPNRFFNREMEDAKKSMFLE